ncbi:futalosine hydrolase [Streptomyces sp. WI04-05B]|uniref:futalosine hydrolase n=1 Tax=Streptomyces TaxID=1883 RepID=UPI0029A1DEC4|nr:MULTISPECIES: futalosine hydrolase [unclassified Streptomyces]MDX2545273.1 futalosine hydrolase [Streptomyces sp. WI04-05B]MDX2587387.1 futalosine hydrolase [Streptomyces sp. WI04-05A]
MVVQAEEGLLTTSGVRVLVATAVPVERDAVAQVFPPGDGPVDVIAVGVGPAASAASVASALTTAALRGTPYDLVVSAGIGGGFQPQAPVGSLVVADEITAADLGAETPEGFVPVTGLGFGTVTHRPPEALVRDVTAVTGARAGAVLTVSTVTGSAERAAELRARHPGALAEAMEGFGVAEAAAAHGVPVLEIRAVSNPVGPRDRTAWRIGDALTALTEAFGKLAPVLESWNPHEQSAEQPRELPREH